jgi:hypothetical protein
MVRKEIEIKTLLAEIIPPFPLLSEGFMSLRIQATVSSEYRSADRLT